MRNSNIGITPIALFIQYLSRMFKQRVKSQSWRNREKKSSLSSLDKRYLLRNLMYTNILLDKYSSIQCTRDLMGKGYNLMMVDFLFLNIYIIELHKLYQIILKRNKICTSDKFIIPTFDTCF